MAINANIAVSNISVDGTGQKTYILATLTYTGTYAASGGDVFDIPAYFSAYKSSPKLPVTVFIQGTAGYGFGYVPGTTVNNGKIKICTASATELGNIAYGAPITGDTGIIDRKSVV